MVEPVVLSYANSSGEVATNKFKMYHIQLPAFRKDHKTLETVKDDVFLSWLHMLDRGYQNQDEMEVLSGMTEGLKNFAAQYNYAISDPELIRRYRMIEDGKRDIATRISAAEKRGREQGKEQGIELGKEQGAKQKNLENAKGFKQQGVDPAIISSVTGLSLEEIAKL